MLPSWARSEESNDLVKKLEDFGIERMSLPKKKSGYVSLLPRVSIGSLLSYGTHEGLTLFLGLGLAPFLSWKHFFPFS